MSFILKKSFVGFSATEVKRGKKYPQSVPIKIRKNTVKRLVTKSRYPSKTCFDQSIKSELPDCYPSIFLALNTKKLRILIFEMVSLLPCFVTVLVSLIQ